MKNKSKFIQILVFISLIIAFTFNHYSVFKTCENTYPKGKEDLNLHLKLEKSKIENTRSMRALSYQLCLKDYGVGYIHIIELKKKQVEKIPADLIFIFIGGGIIYFTKSKKRKE